MWDVFVNQSENLDSFATHSLLSLVRTISSNQNGKYSSKIEEKPAEIDFSRAIADFQKNGMAILPIKIDPSFLNESKELCFSAWKDALNRAKIIKGNDS